MSTVGDLWLLRNPPITESEWRSVVAARSDFSYVEAPFGRTQTGKAVELSPIYFWTGDAGGQVPFSFSAAGVHIGSNEPITRRCADELAKQLGAVVVEG